MTNGKRVSFYDPATMQTLTGIIAGESVNQLFIKVTSKDKAGKKQSVLYAAPRENVQISAF